MAIRNVRIGDRIRLFLPVEAGGTVFESKVDVVESKRFWVIDPDPGFQVGEGVRCERIIDDDARYGATAKVLSRAGGALALEHPKNWARIQARAHVRTATDRLSVQIKNLKDNGCVTAAMVDVSAGGARVESPEMFEEGEEVEVEFGLNELSILFQTTAVIRRSFEIEPGVVQVGMQFTGLSEDEQQTVTRWVFVEQIRQRHKSDVSHEE